MWHIKRHVPSLYQAVLVLVSLCAAYMAGGLLGKIQEQRSEYRLTENEPLENAPPELVLATTALGGFRGLIIDYLWMRATELRYQGAHYEIVQLYDWIGKLEPRLPEVWNYTAHEMVYNISITMPTPQERWRWVVKGIEHIRDFGLVYNQRSPKLYLQLATIFWDKLGVNSVDEYRFYYQKRWADQMEELLGDPQNIEELAEVARLSPAWLQTPEIAEFLNAAQAINIDIVKDYFTLGNLAMPQLEQWRNLVATPKQQAIFRKVAAYLKANRLLQQYKLDPVKMLALQAKYGAVDFRLTYTHALYWANEGIEVMRNLPEFEGTVIYANTARILRGSLEQNFEYGQLVSKNENYFICIPNFALLGPLYRLFEEHWKTWGDKDNSGMPSYETFLRQVVWYCHMYNRRKEAAKFYRILGQKFPNNPDYQQDLDTYGVQQVAGRVKYMGRRVEVENYMLGVLLVAFHSLQLGIDQYEGLCNFAKLMHQEYHRRHGGLEGVSPSEQPRQFSEFQHVAGKIFYDSLIKDLGVAGGQKMWERLVTQYPFLEEFGK